MASAFWPTGPGVGANLQDHLELYIQMAATQPVSLYRYWNLLGKAYVGARWLFTSTGPGASNQFEARGSSGRPPGVEYPDIQFHFLPLAVRYDGKAAAGGARVSGACGADAVQKRGAA
jgi:choline dehydrogenase